VRTGNGALPRTTTVPRNIRRRRASRPTASRVGPVATPYSIQRGPSTPTNTEVAPPVVACSSRPHSPVNDRTRAPPSRSDASISVARSVHNPPVRGAASALTDSRPSGTVTWTAWMRPAVLGSTETVPPAGTGTRTAPKSTVPGAGVISGESVSPSCGPFVGMRMRWVARLSPFAGAAAAAPRLRATRRPPRGGGARPSSRSPRCRARRRAGALPRRTWRTRRVHHELGDPVAAADPDRGARIEVDEAHDDLAAVARVDGARRVDDGEAAPRGQARTGVHEARVAGRQRDRDARRHQRAFAGRQHHVGS